MRAMTPSPLVASRTAEVAVASSSSTPCSRATRAASATACSRAATPSSLIDPSGVRKRMSRNTVRVLVDAKGRPPGWASATSRWTVFEPMSRTPSRTRSAYPAPARRRGAPRLYPAVATGVGTALIGSAHGRSHAFTNAVDW